MSEEFRVSKVAGVPYERNARTNAQRSNVKGMNEPVVQRSPPTDKWGLLYRPGRG